MGIGLKYKDERHIFDEREKDGVPYLSFPLLEQTGIVNQGFSTRLGGVSQGGCASMNISTHRGVASAVGVDPEKMVYTCQTHTTNVALVTGEDAGKSLPETDGMITRTPGLCLVTFYADCVPLYFVDPVRKAVGLSHSGWRGTVGDMAGVTVGMMGEVFGSRPEDILAAVGPSICQDCYEVSEDVVSQFRESYPAEEWEELFYQKEEQRKKGKYQLDLWRANELNLLRAGLLPEHIAVTNLCTCCNPGLLFSHRVTGWNRGNLSAFLALKE
mgnify:CR=1 FL=1